MHGRMSELGSSDFDYGTVTTQSFTQFSLRYGFVMSRRQAQHSQWASLVQPQTQASAGEGCVAMCVAHVGIVAGRRACDMHDSCCKTCRCQSAIPMASRPQKSYSIALRFDALRMLLSSSTSSLASTVRMLVHPSGSSLPPPSAAAS